MADAARWERIWELYEEVSGLDPARWPAYLEKAGAEDHQVRAQVEELLRRSLPGSSFLEDGPILAALAGQDPESRLGTSVGPYRLEAIVGSGGMGVVYRARQSEPVRRQVALKLIRHGPRSGELLARFEAERQALAVLAHPNVAKVFEVGTTGDGQPFLAMELVDGTPISSWCNERELTIRQRLELLLPVCDAVQHAHQKGIVHRDLKPTNILVTADEGDETSRPRPLVIDFGVAKFLDPELGRGSAATRVGTMVGTPEYMSPEQWEMAGDVDTRSDVYSLGVILYELLTGVLPLPLADKPYAEARVVQRATEPRRPSLAATHAAREVRGDLDWITMRALEKDRERRYASVSEMAADIQRHLDGLPVEAGPPSRMYRVRKLVWRHRVGAAATAIAALALVTGLAATLWMAHEAFEARDEARRQAELAEATSAFLETMFTAPTPWHQDTPAGVETAVGEVLEGIARKLDHDMAGKPLLEARLRRSLAGTYSSLHQPEAAARQLRRALEIHRTHLGDRHPETLRTRLDLGIVTWQQRWPEGISDALERIRDVYEDARAELAPDHVVVRSALFQMSQLLGWQGRHEEARTYASEGLRLFELEPDVPADPVPSDFYARMATRAGLSPAARAELLGRLIERRRRQFGDAHESTVEARRQLAKLQTYRGDPSLAASLWPDVIDSSRARWGEGSAPFIEDLWGYAHVLEHRGELAEAEKILRRALALSLETFGEGSAWSFPSRRHLAELLLEAGRLEEAQALATDAWQESLRARPDDARLRERRLLARVLIASGEHEQAERMLLEALEIARRAEPAVGVVDSTRALIDLYEAWDKPTQAARYRALLRGGNRTAAASFLARN